MIHPKLLASQELALHRVNVQQQSFAATFTPSPDMLNHAPSLNSLGQNNNDDNNSNAFPRVSSSRSELSSPLHVGGASGATVSPSPFSRARSNTTTATTNNNHIANNSNNNNNNNNSGGSSGSVNSNNIAAAAAAPPLVSPLVVGCGANSTAPANIARPQIRQRPEWAKALDDAEYFSLPLYRLLGSTPETRRRVAVWYIADKHDRCWLAQRPSPVISVNTSLSSSSSPAFSSSSSAAAVAVAVSSSSSVVVSGGATKGKTGGMEPAPQASALLSANSRITVTLFERLMTAFEICAYNNPEIPVQRQPVSSLESVLATGADSAVVEKVRQYWLGRRQALGGNIPCIPALHVLVQEENQSTLCHGDVLQYCPLPFNNRNWSIAVLQRSLPQHTTHEEEEGDEGLKEEREEEDAEGTSSFSNNNNNKNNHNHNSNNARKNRSTKSSGHAHNDSSKAAVTIKREKSKDDENSNNNEAVRTPKARKRLRDAEMAERRTLLNTAQSLANAVLQREEWKLRHTHLALYELALLRRAAVADLHSNNNNDLHHSSQCDEDATLWATEEALQEEWTENTEFVAGEGIEGMLDTATAAAESVIGIGDFLY